MRVTVVAHATLRVESEGTDLLIDPWLSGSCYWRSWWHYPPAAPLDGDALAPKFICLSHHHFDHFHYPSLRKLDRGAHVLVPRYGVDVMRKELAALGFHSVTELAHGRALTLDGGLSITAYQYGVDDSAFVVRRGTSVVVDLNDCKLRGRALRQLFADHGAATLMLKNYSAAQAYPGCYRATDPKDLGMISRRAYLVDFHDAARELSARYAVPFASMTCFLHPETFARNREVVLPGHLREFFAAHPLPGTELVVMAPGDSWSAEAGFAIGSGDPYSGFEREVEAMASEVRERIEVAAAAEAQQSLGWPEFHRYFDGLVSSLAWPVRRLFRGSVVFRVGEEHWVVDPRHRRVYPSAGPPPGWATIITAPTGVLADAIAKRIVHFVHISMRLSVELNEGGVGTDFLFWGVLTVFELGYLPLRRLSPRRVAGVGWRRRRELFDALRLALTARGSGIERMAGSLMPTGTDQRGGEPV